MSGKYQRQQGKSCKKNIGLPDTGKDSRTGSPSVILTILIVIVGIAVVGAHWPALSAKALSFDDGQYLIWDFPFKIDKNLVSLC